MHFADNLREVYDLCQKMLYGDGDSDYATDFGLSGMAIRVVEFSSGGYKIRKIFAKKST